MLKTTEELHADMVNRLSKPGEAILATLTPHKVHLWHMLTLLTGEAGELSEGLKKHLIYGKPLNLKNVVEELGDIEFALAGIRNAFNLTREDCLADNMDKLERGENARYSSGSYSDVQAQTRADKQ